ncbi:unnamed protein product [Schistosoma margrebowiei]|uniref:Uncharacterized protein n=1 Tax=Schistosoma margrebowiei TaxID=48269 RepID=A0A183N0E8_9TREM|nr:unnamed protein product [Schistosoma margrebowiei]
MRSSPSKCKFLLHDWPASTPELRVRSKVVERDNFTYLGSLISPNELVSDEISARIRKARLAFANLRHLWRRRDIRLSINGRVYCTAVRSVLFYDCETWPLSVEDTLLFGIASLHPIATVLTLLLCLVVCFNVVIVVAPPTCPLEDTFLFYKLSDSYDGFLRYVLQYNFLKLIWYFNVVVLPEICFYLDIINVFQ